MAASSHIGGQPVSEQIAQFLGQHHGNGTMAEDFEICGLLDQLAERYRVIAVDRPGFGYTERPRSRIWTASAQAHLLHRVLQRLKVERPVIVGHSWGTLVALALETANWRELRGLVLLSGYYYPTRRADLALLSPLAIPGLGDAARSLMPQALGPLIASQVFRHVFKPEPVPTRFKARFPAEITSFGRAPRIRRRCPRLRPCSSHTIPG